MLRLFWTCQLFNIYFFIQISLYSYGTSLPFSPLNLFLVIFLYCPKYYIFFLLFLHFGYSSRQFLIVSVWFTHAGFVYVGCWSLLSSIFPVLPRCYLLISERELCLEPPVCLLSNYSSDELLLFVPVFLFTLVIQKVSFCWFCYI